MSLVGACKGPDGTMRGAGPQILQAGVKLLCSSNVGFRGRQCAAAGCQSICKGGRRPIWRAAAALRLAQR